VPRVELVLEPQPSHVRTARQVAVAVARRAGLPDETVADVRLAVGEATGLLLRLDPGREQRVRVGLVDDDGLTVDLSSAVRNAGSVTRSGGASASAPLDGEGAGRLEDTDELPVAAVVELLEELASRVQLTTDADRVTLSLAWDAPLT
jgi:hypothetical protein